MSLKFDYRSAYSRNIGWFTDSEQQWLKTRKVAIAGMGGVGGSHLLTLTRLGIGHFHLADFDSFEVENFNRQAGARMSSVGKPKLATLIDMARDINPELEITSFPNGVDAENLDDFFDGVDVYVDGLDFFALDIRRKVFQHCRKQGIPATTVAPLGMGAAMLNFVPDGMSFEEYFRLEGYAENEQYLRFFIGLAPSRLHQSYLVDPSRIDLKAKKGPSTAIGCELCAGVAASQVVKMLLKRGTVVAAPRALHYDAYRNKLAKTWTPGGNNNWLRRLAISLGKKVMLESNPDTPIAEARGPQTPAEQVLDLARWAPSGDNTQPWQFELHSDQEFSVHFSDTRDWVVYDLDGHASQLAVGAFLESADLAAAKLGYRLDAALVDGGTESNYAYRFSLIPDSDIEADPLVDFLTIRAVQRRAMQRRDLTATERQMLLAAVPEGYRLVLFETKEQRWQAAKLMFNNAKVRLTMPEAYEVHRHIIDWGKQFSEDKIPEQARWESIR